MTPAIIALVSAIVVACITGGFAIVNTNLTRKIARDQKKHSEEVTLGLGLIIDGMQANSEQMIEVHKKLDKHIQWHLEKAGETGDKLIVRGMP